MATAGAPRDGWRWPLDDAVASADLRLLLLGLESTGSSSSSSTRQGAERTAEKFLCCLRKVQWELQRTQLQQALMATVLRRRDISPRKRAPTTKVKVPERPDTAKVLQVAKAKNGFWESARGDVWRKRELPAGGESPQKRSDSKGASTSLPPVSHARTTSGFRVLSSFGQGQRWKSKGANGILITLDGAVDMMKEHGIWPGQQPLQVKLPLAQSQSTPVLPSVTRSQEVAKEPSIEEASPTYSASPAASSLERPRDFGLSSPKNQPLDLQEIFPGLGTKRRMPPRRLVFAADGEAHAGKSRLLEAFVIPQRKELTALEESEGLPPAPPEEDECSEYASFQSQGWSEAEVRDHAHWTRRSSVLKRLPPDAHLISMGTSPFPTLEPQGGPAAGSAQFAFLASCTDAGVLPLVSRSMMAAVSRSAPARELNLASYGVGDTGLRALADALPCLGPIEALNLASNRLSSGVLGAFLPQRLPAHGGSLRLLDLSGNREIGATAVPVLAELLQDSQLRVLETLRLNEVEAPDASWALLFEGILSAGTLRSLSLAATRLGFVRQTLFKGLGRLIAEGVLTSVDLSNNFLRKEGCQELQKALAATITLRMLDLSHTSSTYTEASEGSPLLLICESLLQNTTLTHVVLTGCKLCLGADMILAEVMQRHSRLETLELQSNPHGVVGCSFLLRSLASPASKLQRLDLGDLREAVEDHPSALLSWAEPSGSYSLHLGNPGHRAVLRALVARAKQSGKDAAACFEGVAYRTTAAKGKAAKSSGFSIASCIPADDKSLAPIPDTGDLSFVLNLSVPPSSPPDSSLGAACGRWWRGATPLGFRRTKVMLETYSSSRCDSDRLVLLEAIGAYGALKLKMAHLPELMYSSPATLCSEVLSLLLPAVEDLSWVVPTDCTRAREEDLAVRRAAHRLVTFCPLNPTGGHKFDLELPCDFACAQRLQHLVRYEREVMLGRPDISQRGLREPVRNVRLNGAADCGGLLQAQEPFSSLQLPRSGHLELDYATLLPAPSSSSTAGLLDKVLGILSRSRSSWEDTLQVFRNASIDLTLSAKDVRRALEALVPLAGSDAGSPKVEVFLACYARCCARPELMSPDLLYDPGLFSAAEIQEIRSRLGAAHVLDWRRAGEATSNLPGGGCFTMELSHHDERQVLLYLLRVAQKEAPGCLTEVTWTAGELAQGWNETFVAAMPTTGTLSFTYVNGPDKKVKPEPRRDLAEKVLGRD